VIFLLEKAIDLLQAFPGIVYGNDKWLTGRAAVHAWQGGMWRIRVLRLLGGVEVSGPTAWCSSP
jgi:hypothetical protein